MSTEKEHKKKRFFTLKNKRHMPTWLAWILALIVKAISLTYRVRFEDPCGWLGCVNGWPSVVAMWHNRILFATSLFPKAVVHKSTVLISASRDGEYVSSFVRFFGINVVRGSSSKGGAQALVALNVAIHEGKSAILTVDGPRGPKYCVHPGAVVLAQKNNVPIIPISINAKSYWQAKSWDNTQIPKPFTKLVIRIGEPLFIENDADVIAGEDRVHDALMALTEDR